MIILPSNFIFTMILEIKFKPGIHYKLCKLDWKSC